MKYTKNLISVIMGIYNIPSKDILESAIESILKQTYKNFEFIINGNCYNSQLNK